MDHITQDAGSFADWAEIEFGVDYDDVRMWDMLAELDAPRSGLLAEQPNAKTIPAALRDILIARKAARVVTPRQPFKSTEFISEWELRDGTAE